MKSINFYKTKSAISPIEEFLDKLADKQVQKILWVLKLIRELDKVRLFNISKNL